MFEKVLIPTAVILTLALAGGVPAVEVNDTQTWGETDLSGQTTTIGPNGDLTINGRVNLDNGTIILNGGRLTINGDFHFADSGDDSNPEHIYLNAGTMTATYTESFRDRNAVVFVGAGEMITGQVSNGGQYDPSDTSYWDIRALEGYGPVHVDDVGDDKKRIWAEASNPDVEFDSASSGDLESVSPATLTVCINNPDEGETYTVDYCVTGGTAEGSGVDYTLECGTLTFNPGETCKTISIEIIDDGLDEQDETIETTLSNPTGTDLVLGDIAQHTYTIKDPRPSVGFGSSSGRAAEDSGSADISIGLSAAVTWPVTVDYAVVGGTATAGEDYSIVQSGTLNFAAGETTKTITMSIVADDIEEGNETVVLRLSNASGAKLGVSEQTFTISEQGPLLRGAFYFRADNDQSARIGPHPDIMVRLGDGDNKLIFRRDKGYLPVWYSEDGGEQDLPVEVNRSGCETIANTYSRVAVIENSPARAVIRWRYARQCGGPGLTDWVEEYFTIYPDGACIRRIKNAAGTGWNQWNTEPGQIKNLQLLAEGVATLPAEWLDAAAVSINSGDYSDEGFDQTRLCYTLQCDVTGAPTALDLTLTAAGGKSIHNPAIVLKNWGDAEADIAVNGQKPSTCFAGYADDMYGDDLVVWLGVESNGSLDISITPSGGSGQFVDRAPPRDLGWNFDDAPPFPMGSDEPGPFGAYYTNLKFNNRFDEPWRVGEYTDVVVQFEDNAHRFVFWRGTNYQPHWATDTSETPNHSNWYGTQFVERRGSEWGIERYLEPMSDWQCRFSHVRIISSNAARAIVQWRYAPCHLNYERNNKDGDIWGDWVNEYFTVYPDAVSVRKVDAWSRRTGNSDQEDPHIEFHEMIPVTNPGTIPEDCMHWNALSMTNYGGSKKDWVWQDRDGGSPGNFGESANRPIMVVRMKGSTVPITVFEGTSTQHDPVGEHDCRPFNHYDDWPAWPENDRSMGGSLWDDDPSTHCYRNFWKKYPAHCSTLHIKWKDYEHIQDKKRTKIMLFGMFDAEQAQNVNNVIPLARSWEYAPGLSISSAGYSGGSYDKTERAYRIRRDSETSAELQFTVNASSDSPVYNPCFVIESWDGEAAVSVDGQELASGVGFEQGVEKTADEVASLVIWLRKISQSPVNVTISQVTKGCPCPGNLNTDTQVDLDDLQALAGMLLQAGSPFVVEVQAGHCGDLNADEQVDLDDLQAVAGILLNAGSPFIVPCE